MKEELTYLGFVIYRQGLSMDRDKVKAILEWLELTNATEFRSLHELASFYRNFIRDFSRICTPLTLCMKKGEFKWMKFARHAFEKMK